MPKGRSQNLLNDQNLLEISHTFFSQAKRLIDNGAKSRPDKGSYWRIIEGNIYTIDEITSNAEQSLVVDLCSKLGSSHGHEDDISKIAWEYAGKTIYSEIPLKEIAREFLQFILKETEKTYIFLAPNSLFKTDFVKKIDIGPVTICDFQAAENIISSEKLPIFLSRGEELVTSIRDGSAGLITGDNIWVVRVNASWSLVADEALWLIDIAVSLLRICAPQWSHPLFPREGEPEPPPIEPINGKSRFIYGHDNKWSAIRSTTPAYYKPDGNLLSAIREEIIGKNINDIFNFKRNSVGERVYSGLGWITRGRRAADPSERLLMFFTAIEALLSEKDEPVTQNISRLSATMITNDISGRDRWSKYIRDLYASRSKTVHQGRRNTTRIDARDAEFLAEGLYQRVIHSLDMGLPSSTFLSDLKRASFGHNWPLE